MDDDEFNTKKKPLYKEKLKSRRWTNCFGLTKKIKRLKNRLSTIQASDTPHQQLSTQRNSNITLNPEHPLHQHQRHHYSTSTIASCSAQESSIDFIEQNNCQPPITTYHLSSTNTPNQSLSPPPRHGQVGRGRAFSDTSGYCYNDWRQFTNSYQKMNLRLSLDTESVHQQHLKQRQDNTSSSANTNTSSSISDSPVDVTSVRNSMIIYQEDDASTLRAHSNSSTISNTSSLIPQAPPTQPASLAPFRSGTLGYPKTTQKIRTDAAPPLPSLPLLAQRQQQQPSTSSTLSLSTTSSGRLSVDSISRSSTLSSIDLPLKERRRRRSPLMFSDSDKLTLPIPRHDIISLQQNTYGSKRMKDGSTSAWKKNVPEHDHTKWKSREKAMQQLEGTSPSPGRKVVSMSRIASPKFLDEQLVAAATTGDSTLLMNKAQYDAVVSRTIQQQRRPSSSIVASPVSANLSVSILTPSTSAAKASMPSPYSNSKSTSSTISPFLPTPSSSSSHHYPPPPPPPAPPSSSVYFPSTPNSLESYL
ncbi:hypothetical protein BCR42DRAFT_407952 [Absidia repens]|uniref:Uncharacterized protein n=1 Tax=Absidia repens TaxID=90262 RepID=A0A1X2ISV1_9FUNG|nr:hypothetical protein BCR42DRAFT_407952 [Absidia repens]